MTTGVADTISKIQAFAAAVTGVTSAPATSYPNALDTASLPAVLTYAGPATTTALTFGPTHRRTERIYYLACYVEPIGQNTSNLRIQDTLTLLQRFLDSFMTNRQIAAGVRTTGDIRDSGVTSGADMVSGNSQYLVYNGQPYTGFVLELRVIEANRA
jgi:hypothetical protein